MRGGKSTRLRQAHTQTFATLRRCYRAVTKGSGRFLQLLSCRSNPKLNSLRQRQLRRPVDSVRLPPHVSFPRVAARLAPAARLLFAAERAANLRAARPDIDI